MKNTDYLIAAKDAADRLAIEAGFILHLISIPYPTEECLDWAALSITTLANDLGKLRKLARSIADPISALRSGPYTFWGISDGCAHLVAAEFARRVIELVRPFYAIRFENGRECIRILPQEMKANWKVVAEKAKINPIHGTNILLAEIWEESQLMKFKSSQTKEPAATPPPARQSPG